MPTILLTSASYLYIRTLEFLVTREAPTFLSAAYETGYNLARIKLPLFAALLHPVSKLPAWLPPAGRSNMILHASLTVVNANFEGALYFHHMGTDLR
jgi:hypothetical protein